MLFINKSVVAYTDTIHTPWFKNLHDTTQIRILAEMSDSCDINEILTYTTQAIQIGKKLTKEQPKLENYIAWYAAALNNEAYYFDQVGNIEGSVKSYLKSLALREKINDSIAIAESYNNLAYMFQQQGDVLSATSYYGKARKIFEHLNDSNGLINVYINIGNSFYWNNEYDSAISYFEMGLDMAQKNNDIKGISYALNNLGAIYNRKGWYEKTEEVYLRSLALREKLGAKDPIARSYHNLGRFYFNRGNLIKSHNYAEKSYLLAKGLNSPDIISDASILLSDIYFKQNNFEKAYHYLTIHIEMKDSIFSSETQKSTIKQQVKYEYDKQKAIDDKEYEKQIAISAEQEKRQKVIIYATVFVLGLVLLFSILIANRLRVTRKQKLVIEEQNREVIQQKEIIEQAHEEITDSIAYAKRIQNAILPSNKIVKEYLEESFILYKPKDIVAGDFYWLEHKEDKILFAAADCTGHGVPGAMVSVVCNNGLNRSVREYGLTNPGEILDKTREIVIQEFAKSEDEVKDGMDIALCSLTQKNGGWELSYAGANNPLWIVREKELIEIKANKQPIGRFDNPAPYTTHNVSLQKGDNIYLFTDGYIDQFGGEKGKKFKTSSLKTLLLSISEKTMEDQKLFLENEFDQWKGDLEQLDDVCVMGIRV
jgi:serine phosphatase RsbU (regulator of sigma subunit)